MKHIIRTALVTFLVGMIIMFGLYTIAGPTAGESRSTAEVEERIIQADESASAEETGEPAAGEADSGADLDDSRIEDQSAEDAELREDEAETAETDKTHTAESSAGELEEAEPEESAAEVLPQDKPKRSFLGEDGLPVEEKGGDLFSAGTEGPVELFERIDQTESGTETLTGKEIRKSDESDETFTDEEEPEQQEPLESEQEPEQQEPLESEQEPEQQEPLISVQASGEQDAHEDEQAIEPSADQKDIRKPAAEWFTVIDTYTQKSPLGNSIKGDSLTDPDNESEKSVPEEAAGTAEQEDDFQPEHADQEHAAAAAEPEQEDSELKVPEQKEFVHTGAKEKVPAEAESVERDLGPETPEPKEYSDQQFDSAGEESIQKKPDPAKDAILNLLARAREAEAGGKEEPESESAAEVSEDSDIAAAVTPAENPAELSASEESAPDPQLQPETEPETDLEPEPEQRKLLSERFAETGKLEYSDTGVEFELSKYIRSLRRIEEIVQGKNAGSEDRRLRELEKELAELIPPEYMRPETARLLYPALEKAQLGVFIYSMQLINLFMPWGSSVTPPTDVRTEMVRSGDAFTLEMELNNRIVDVYVDGYGDFIEDSPKPFVFHDVITKMVPRNGILRAMMKNNRYRLTDGGTAVLQHFLHVL